MATFISVKTLKLFFVIVCALHKPRNIWRCNQGKKIFQNKEPFVSESTTARWESGRSQTVTTSSLIREISSYKLGQALSNTQLSYWAFSITALLRNTMRVPAFFGWWLLDEDVLNYFYWTANDFKCCGHCLWKCHRSLCFFPGLPASDLNQYKEIPVGPISFEDITTAFVKMLRIVLVQGLLVANVVLANEVFCQLDHQ